MRSRIAVYIGFAAVCLLILASNWLIVHGHIKLALLLCASLPAVGVLAWAGLSVSAALLLLLTLDGVPGLNLSSLNVHGSFEALDVCAIALIVLAAIRHFYGTREPRDRYSRQLVAWFGLFLIIWLFAFVQGLNRDVPALKAALFGRDFLFFALLVPVARSLFKDERDLRRFICVAAAMVTAFALGEIIVSLGHLSPSLLNARHTLQVGPVTRVYSPMNDFVALGFACALAYSLLNSGRNATLAGVMATICGLAVVLQLTRALYIGLIVGMALAFIVWIKGRSQVRVRLRRRLAWGAVVMVVFSLFVASAAPQVLSASSVQTITNRIGEGASDVGSSGNLKHNTVAYRQNVSSAMFHVLGSRWVLGLGFLHPAVVHFSQFPHGSIRDNDLGVLNSLMTMGAVGTVLIYAPVLIALGCLLPARRFQVRWDWLRLGCMVWLISVIVGSLSLVTLFSPNGLALTAVVLGAIFRIAQPSDRQLGARM